MARELENFVFTILYERKKSYVTQELILRQWSQYEVV